MYMNVYEYIDIYIIKPIEILMTSALYTFIYICMYVVICTTLLACLKMRKKKIPI